MEYKRTRNRLLEQLHTDVRCRGLFIQGFLIKPIGRICKYPLLLRVCFKIVYLNLKANLN